MRVWYTVVYNEKYYNFRTNTFETVDKPTEDHETNNFTLAMSVATQHSALVITQVE